MSRKRYSAELIIGQLRQAEILVPGGKTIAEVVRQLNISEQTYYSQGGVSGSGPGSADAALHTKGFGRRSGTDGKHCLSGIRVWMNTPARVWQSR